MLSNNDLDAILKRFENGQESEEDLRALRQILRGDTHLEVLQKLAKYNVHVQELTGRDLQIGDRIYNGWTEQAFDALLLAIRTQIAELLQAQLTKADLNTDQETIGSGEIPPCPYQGLSAFQEEHAEFFFGRDRFIDLLVRKVETKPLVAVVGSSGSGKSSLVFAGLVPRLRQTGDWLIVSFRPKNQPFYELAGALVQLLEPNLGETDQVFQAAKLAEYLQSGEVSLQQVVSRIQKQEPQSPKLLLIADQFEELYTLAAEGDPIPFIDVLLVGIKNISGFKLVLTLRADFCEQAYKHEQFTNALQDADLKLSAMNREDLRLAIECPAKLQQVELEAGLVERILDDVGEEPGRLPLLEFALTQLWAKQRHGKLTHQAYTEIGGVTKALANHAETVYGQLSEVEKRQAKQLFLQLVQLGEGAKDTRRLATRAEVENWHLVTLLADEKSRLIVTGYSEESKEEIVEVAHEALIRGWHRLNQWIDENRQQIRQQRRIEAQAEEWLANNKSPDFLLKGIPLANARLFQRAQYERLESPISNKRLKLPILWLRLKLLIVQSIIFITPDNLQDAVFLIDKFENLWAVKRRKKLGSLTLSNDAEKLIQISARYRRRGQLSGFLSLSIILFFFGSILSNEYISPIIQTWNAWLTLRIGDRNYSPQMVQAVETLARNGVNIAHLELMNSNLNGIILKDIDMLSVNFSSSVLAKADLRRIYSLNTDFTKANLADADISGAELRNTKLASANLSNSNVTFTYLYRVDFSNANLSNANLNMTWLCRVNFREANLSRASLINADLSSTNLEAASSLSGALYSKETVFPPNFEPTTHQMRLIDSSVDLSSASLNGVDLSGINLENAHLSRADLSNSDLRSASLRGADLSFVKFKGSRFGSINVYLINWTGFKGWTTSKVKKVEKCPFPGSIEEKEIERLIRLERYDRNSISADRSYLGLEKIEEFKFDYYTNLQNADLNGADLAEVNLENVDLRGVRNLTIEQVRSTQNWKQAIYDEKFCEQLKNGLGLKECRTKS